MQLVPGAPQLLPEVPGWQVPTESQQPVGQVVALQMAATHTFIWQVPEPQDWHVTPFFPQASVLVPPRHTPFWQQPPEHVVASHRRSQTWLVQVVAHCEQATPPVPHAPASVPAVHTPLKQQPEGQVVESQVLTHTPASASQVPAPHDRQPRPPMPHARLSRPPPQLAPEQQPRGQFEGLQGEVVQVPAVQAVPPQSRQARPPTPQDADELPVRQRPPMQQPEHEAAVHWQSPRRHSTPGAQAGPLPH